MKLDKKVILACLLICLLLFFLADQHLAAICKQNEQRKAFNSTSDIILEEFLKTFANKSQQLPDENFQPTQPEFPSRQSTAGLPTSSFFAPCPAVPIVSVEDGGRLGNKIWEYAAVWSAARVLGRPGYVPRTILTALSQVFSNLSLTALEDIGQHCGVRLEAPVPKQTVQRFVFNSSADQEEGLRGKHILLQKYIVMQETVLLFKRQLHKEFHFRPEILQQVRETIVEHGGEGRVLVGIHVRRTDFARYLPARFSAQLIGADYFKKAMQWFRDNIPGQLLFLVVSDDLKWCRQHLKGKDVVVASKSVAHDLALLSTSHHVIIDYGTFGYWGGLMVSLSGGHTISLNLVEYFNSQMKLHFKHWHPVDPKTLNFNFKI